MAAVKEVNRRRLAAIPERKFSGKSCHAEDIERDKSLAVSYIVAPPRMAKYMEYSTRIYQIYLRYFAPEDMHVYSVDEVFMDATRYLDTYKMSARELTRKIIQDILAETGITATAGIGTNLYLCKIAMDVWAKHTEADKDGVRIAEAVSLGSQADYGFLAGGQRVCKEAGGKRHVYHGGRCPLFRRQAGRVL